MALKCMKVFIRIIWMIQVYSFVMIMEKFLLNEKKTNTMCQNSQISSKNID